MFKFKLLLCAGIFLAFSGTNAQVGKEEKKADRQAYNEAYNLRQKAVWLTLGNEDKKLKMFSEANEIYPGDPNYFMVSEGSSDMLVLTLFKDLKDYRTANKEVDKAIAKLKQMGEVYLGQSRFHGKYIQASDYIRWYHYFRAKYNLIDGDAELGLRDLAAIFDIGYNDKEFIKRTAYGFGMVGSGVESNVYALGQWVAFLKKDKQTILKLEPFLEATGNSYGALRGKIFMHIIDGQYKQAIELAENAEKETNQINRQSFRYLLALTYALSGQSHESRKYLDILVNTAYADEKDVALIAAINEFNLQNFEEAEHLINLAITPARLGLILKSDYEIPGKFYMYELRARIHIAQKRYDLARADFETALLYMPNYEPALNGLAQLESTIVTEMRSDKTPPTITIIEPAASRGSIAALASDFTIKGLAQDPAGIQSVLANGETLFVKDDGNFWGSVALKPGQNTIEIVATDRVGNIRKVKVEIERNAIAENSAVEQKASKNYAFIIAAQNYDDISIPSLEYPVVDAIRLKMLLKEQYLFAEENIVTTFNPYIADIKKKFSEFYEVLQPEDNLIIFYAGHGIWVEKEKKGYWLLPDSKRSEPSTWFSNKEMLSLIANAPAKNILLITDACFSGSVFKTRSIGPDAPQNIKELSNKISRVAITSGNDTEVPDESVFMKYLVKALSENKEKYLTAQKMFINNIIEAVMTESKTEPRYGTLELAGHVGGDYIFSRKN